MFSDGSGAMLGDKPAGSFSGLGAVLCPNGPLGALEAPKGVDADAPLKGLFVMPSGGVAFVSITTGNNFLRAPTCI